MADETGKQPGYSTAGLKLALFGFILGLFWVRLGSFWVRFGFVFRKIVHSSLFVVHCIKRSCIHLGFFAFGFVWVRLGSFWVCFSHVNQVSNCHNPLLKLRFRLFERSANWLCFA